MLALPLLLAHHRTSAQFLHQTEIQSRKISILYELIINMKSFTSLIYKAYRIVVLSQIIFKKLFNQVIFFCCLYPRPLVWFRKTVTATSSPFVVLLTILWRLVEWHWAVQLLTNCIMGSFCTLFGGEMEHVGGDSFYSIWNKNTEKKHKQNMNLLLLVQNNR